MSSKQHEHYPSARDSDGKCLKKTYCFDSKPIINDKLVPATTRMDGVRNYPCKYQDKLQMAYQSSNFSSPFR